MVDKADLGSPPSLADRLNRLYASVLPAGRKPHTDREVAAAITAAGTPISASYLNLLRTGERVNPTKRHLEGLAAYFGVPVAYFFDDDVATRTDEDLRRLHGLRTLSEAFEHPEIAAIALKAKGLSRVSLDQIAAIIDHVRSLEQATGQAAGRTSGQTSGHSTDGPRSVEGTTDSDCGSVG